MLNRFKTEKKLRFEGKTDKIFAALINHYRLIQNCKF